MINSNFMKLSAILNLHDKEVCGLVFSLTSSGTESMMTVSNIKEILSSQSLINSSVQKQPSRGVRKKRCSENMQQIYRTTPMPKCDFNKVALQLY